MFSVNSGQTVVRMFISGPSTVRWETHVNGPRGLQLTVFGPGVLRRTYTFPDAFATVQYQSQFEQHLLASGYALSAVAERRSGHDRRRRPRGTERRTPSHA